MIIYIATDENFYVIKDFKKELLFKDTFWNSLYPNSIAVMDKSKIFIGIRSGYIKINLDKKDFIFYKYKQ